MRKSSNSWYAVTANYKALHVGKSRQRHLWEEIVFLVFASDDEHANEKGHELAKAKEHEYRSVVGDLIFWQFVEITDVKELIDQKLKPGMEVSWKFFERIDKPETASGT